MNPNTVTDRKAGQDSFGSTGGPGMTTNAESPHLKCGEPSEASFGTTEIGRWLEDLVIHVGAPQEGVVDLDEVADTGTALQIDGDAYGDRIEVYISAQRPPDPDFSPDTAVGVGHYEDFTIYYEEGPAWKAFTAVNDQWQLSLIGFPGVKAQSVPWTPRSTEILGWFSRALARAEQDPPPCS